MGNRRGPVSNNRDRVGDTQEGREIKMGPPNSISYFLAKSFSGVPCERLISGKANQALTRCHEELLLIQFIQEDRKQSAPVSGWR